MPKIYIAKPFVLSLDGGEQVKFSAGAHTVEQDIADHWFVKAHTAESAPTQSEDVAAEMAAKDAEIETLKAALAEAVAAKEEAAKAKPEAPAKAKKDA